MFQTLRKGINEIIENCSKGENDINLYGILEGRFRLQYCQ